ncbi:MAG: hypothetical protein JSW58_06305 [Candidatus Latescibacterota bacterium]|nr:MAG: hypothetical protein JSW58_06305 [Candidatus Latescibacterota bacterium]
MGVQVTKDPVKETLVPDPDGVTVDFQTSANYQPGSVAIWFNGVKLIREWDDGFAELGGNTVRMAEAPRTGDSLQVEYEAA